MFLVQAIETEFYSFAEDLSTGKNINLIIVFLYFSTSYNFGWFLFL